MVRTTRPRDGAPPPGPKPPGAPSLTKPSLAGLKLGDHWATVDDVSVPGLPAFVSAVVGACGTVLLSTVADAGQLCVVKGKPYCGATSLEPAIVELTKASHDVTTALRDRTGVTPVVYTVLIAPGARSPLFHLDVLITSPASLARALLSFPAVHAPAEVATSAQALRDQAGTAAGSSDGPPAGAQDAAGGTEGVAGNKGPRPMPETWANWARAKNPRSLHDQPGGQGRPAAPRDQPGLHRDQPGPHRDQPGPRRDGRRRRWSLRRHGSLALIVMAAAVLAAAWYSHDNSFTQSSTQPPVVPPGPVAQTYPAAASTTVPSFVSPMSYPGHEAGDVVANAAGTVEVAGASITLASPRVAPSLVGHLLLCVSVSVRDSSGPKLGNGAINWAVRSPSGSIEHPASMGTHEVLAHGELVPGDTVTGKLCFNEPGQGGLYVLSYQPRARRYSAPKVAPEPWPRGVWLLRLP